MSDNKNQRFLGSLRDSKKSQREIKDNKKWEVSIIKICDNGANYKVTRRVPEMGVAETKILKNR